MTAYDGVAITYDQMGNPLNDGTWTYTWEHGRQLASMAKSGTTWTYTYDANGMRTSRSNGTDTYTYVYNGGQLVQMTVGTHTLYFTYDAGGAPATVTLDGTMYYYITNLQGDVVAIWDETSNYICDYYYDAWGKVISRSYSTNHLIDDLNPLLYRGYVYDHDTNLYYLQSRYYNPEIGRFINADTYTSTGTGVLGNNMFAYCNNTPVNAFDPDGHVILYISIRDDPTFNMFFGCGGGGGGGGSAASVAAVANAVGPFEPGEDAALEKTTYLPNSVLHEKIFAWDSSVGVFNHDEVTLTSASLSLYQAESEWNDISVSLLSFGTAEVSTTLTKEQLHLCAIASIWTPSVTYQIGGIEISLTANVGSIGREFSLGLDGVTIGAAAVVGFSISIGFAET